MEWQCYWSGVRYFHLPTTNQKMLKHQHIPSISVSFQNNLMCHPANKYSSGKGRKHRFEELRELNFADLWVIVVLHNIKSQGEKENKDRPQVSIFFFVQILHKTLLVSLILWHLNRQFFCLAISALLLYGVLQVCCRRFQSFFHLHLNWEYETNGKVYLGIRLLLFHLAYQKPWSRFHHLAS